MPRSPRALPFRVAVDPAAAEPLHAQLRERLREAVLGGLLAPGLRLPSSRLLAAECGCARGTVLLALEQLVAEGYAETVPGSGTFVTRHLPEALLHVAPASRDTAARDTTAPGLAARGTLAPTTPPAPRLSRRAEAALAHQGPPMTRPGEPPAFAISSPALDAFPFPLWARLLEAEWRQPGPLAVPSHPFGHDGLRSAIAAYLGAARGFACDPAEIVVVHGVRQALGLLVRLLLDPGDAAWMEEPGFWGTRDALVAGGARPVPVAVDEDGMRVADALARAPEARLAVVTPSHHYPLGAVMSLSRRLELLRWAEAQDAWVFEDDYDGEYRYAGRPLAPLRALERAGRAGRVAYAGSFSKVLFPALRLGFLVLPRGLAAAAARLMAASGQSAPLLGQAALARFITEGHFAAHLRRTRHLYAARQAALVEAAGRYLAGLLLVPPGDAGMHLVARPDPAIAPGFDEGAVVRAAALAQVTLSPLGHHYTEAAAARPGLLLGYAAAPVPALQEAVLRLRGVLERLAAA